MPTLYEQLQTLLDAEKTEEALELFAQSEANMAFLLRGSYNSLLNHKAMGDISPEDWRINLNRIHFALLESARPETAAPELVGDLREPTEKAAPEIRRAMGQGRIEEAIELLRRNWVC